MLESQVIAVHHAPGLRFREELRPAAFTGPMQACHPDEVELCLLVEGIEHVRHGRRGGLTVAGQYSLVAAGCEHSSWTDDRPVRERILHIGRERLAALADDAGLAVPRDLPTDAHGAPSELVAALSLLSRELAGGDAPGHRLLVDALVTAVWVPLLRRHGDREPAAPPAAAAADRRLRRVEECLRADVAAPHSLDDLARLAGLSRYHLLRSFKRRYGLPPYAYLTRLRVERAAALALETDLPLTHIAQEVGFGSSSRLTEAFQRRFGQTPSGWRRDRQASALSGNPGGNNRVSADRVAT